MSDRVFFCRSVMITILIVLTGPVALAQASRPAEAPQKVSPLTLSGETGAWSYRCTFPGEHPSSGPQNCVMQQTLMAQNGGEGNASAGPVGMVLLARVADDAHKVPLSKRPWRLTVMAPLGLSLKKQPQLLVDGHEAMTLEWQSCVVTGCLASLDLTSSQAASWQKGHKGQFSAEKVLNGTLTIDFSLEGVDKGMTLIERWGRQSPLQ